jgi:hypothetical protein
MLLVCMPPHRGVGDTTKAEYRARTPTFVKRPRVRAASTKVHVNWCRHKHAAPSLIGGHTAYTCHSHLLRLNLAARCPCALTPATFTAAPPTGLPHRKRCAREERLKADATANASLGTTVGCQWPWCDTSSRRDK